MICTIEWPKLTRDQWNDLFAKCPHGTLLQSYYYAQAMREVHQQTTQFGLIKIDGINAGIVQMQEVSLFKKAVHGLSIDRGPCWFDGFGKATHINVFADTLNAQFPARFGRRRRFMPEYFGKSHLIALKNWIKTKKTREYHTYIVDISKELSDIRKNLKQNWRNHLNKGEKQGLIVEIDENLSSLGQLLQNHTQDRLKRRFAGTSPRFLAAMAKYAAINHQCLILNAREDNEIIASIMVFIHGQGATYQVGWTTPYGRDKRAHQLLLWRAIETLKHRNIHEFDLGGYNDDTDDIRKFKEGMGGHVIALIGSYS